VRDEVRRIQRSQNIAALLVTHDQDEALALADRIAILREGRLVQAAPASEIYDRPADGFVAGFVGRANLLPGEIAGAERVDTALGALATPPHGKPAGERVLVLIRPERLEVAPAAGAPNTFAVEVTHDRFFGATRRSISPARACSRRNALARRQCATCVRRGGSVPRTNLTQGGLRRCADAVGRR
jgi:putative spermidine/putrescine transport system ATP-binding protein